MKKTSIFLVGILAVITLLVSWKVADNRAVITDGLCNFIDGNGVWHPGAGAAQMVATSSGQVSYVCKATGLPNDTGKTVHWDNENTGATCLGGANWKMIISPNGNGSVVCHMEHE
ncbi:hypothetical protein LL912_24940 [Niabella sp. CC-SYL272]|uniref:hypothetical protein n=1 Tax=Niabella agricola TaxID=2891571 RepID=UPI001F197E6E|nr:hypothetical protein [Niabella agricola]MCF3112058.1 hypothetical protein [Niabella agricola]